MAITLFGIVIDASEVQFANVPPAIDFIPSGISIAGSFAHPEKALCPILVML
jgi:hypothetical protein